MSAARRWQSLICPRPPQFPWRGAGATSAVVPHTADAAAARTDGAVRAGLPERDPGRVAGHAADRRRRRLPARPAGRKIRRQHLRRRRRRHRRDARVRADHRRGHRRRPLRRRLHRATRIDAPDRGDRRDPHARSVADVGAGAAARARADDRDAAAGLRRRCHEPGRRDADRRPMLDITPPTFLGAAAARTSTSSMSMSA